MLSFCCWCCFYKNKIHGRHVDLFGMVDDMLVEEKKVMFFFGLKCAVYSECVLKFLPVSWINLDQSEQVYILRLTIQENL